MQSNKIKKVLTYFGYIKIILLLPFYFDNPWQILVNYLKKGAAVAQIKKGKAKLLCKKGSKLTIGGVISVLKQNWEVSNTNNDQLLFKKKNIRLIQPHTGVLSEDLNILINQFDIKNKIVLDIGGYFGETAIAFKKIGKCKRIIVFEPLPENLIYIRKNIKLNNLIDDVLVYPYAVSNKNGHGLIESELPPGDAEFGLTSGKYKEKIQYLSWLNVVKMAIDNHVFLAKVDCEGSEQYIIDIEDNLIKQIPCWIIETHNRKIKNQVIQKFKICGFKFKKIDQKRLEDVELIKFYY